MTALTIIINFAIVGLGGGIGAMSRFAVEHMPFFENDKYYYTVGINLSGCLIIGILWALMVHWQLDRRWFLFVLTGILGGYTTYSAFTLDAMQLVQNGLIWRALFYITITVVGGLSACALGLFGTERLLKIF